MAGTSSTHITLQIDNGGIRAVALNQQRPGKHSSSLLMQPCFLYSVSVNRDTFPHRSGNYSEPKFKGLVKVGKGKSLR